MKIKALLILAMIALSLLSVSSVNAVTATYSYDELNRLTQVIYDDGTIINYAYDEIGNRTEMVFYLPETTAPTVSGFTIPSTSASLTVPVTTFTATDNVEVTGYLITEINTPPSSGAAGWTSSAPATYIAAAVGSHTLYPWAKDASGNVSPVYGSPGTVVIDTSLPIVSGFAIPSTSNSLTVSVTTFTATDNIGVTGYLITESNTPPSSGAVGWTSSASATYTAAISGSHTLYPWAKDAAGNVSAAYGSPKTVVIETTAPKVSGFTMPATSASLTVPVTTFTATDNVGVTGYLITESNTPPSSGAAGWTSPAPAGYTAAISGSHTLYPWAKDAAGNVSAVFATPRTVVIDTTAPTVSGFTMPATSASLTVPVTTFTATDNIKVTGYLITDSSTPPLSGATGWTTAAPASYIAAAVGNHTLYPWAKDAVGNVSAVYATPGTVVIDTAKPAVSAFTMPATSASLTVPVTTFTATDNIGVAGYLITESSTLPLSGAAGWMTAAPAAYTAAAVGSHKLYPWVKDAAGNVSAVFATPQTVVIDTAKPILSAFTIPASSNSLTVSVTTFTATDNVGVTGYLITESSTPPLPGATGWTTVKPASYIAAAAGSHTLYPWAEDAAGNVSAVFATPRTVVIDTTVPTVSGFTMPATSASLTVPVTTFTATDNIGVTGYLITESSTPPISGAAGWTTASPASYIAAAVGSHTLYPWAKDAAGNVSALFATPQTVVIDTTKPTLSGFTMPATSASLTVPVTTLTATDNIGVTGYLITESSTLPLSGAAGWTTAAPAAYTAATAGSHKLYPWAKDAAGNVSAAYATPRTVVITLQ